MTSLQERLWAAALENHRSETEYRSRLQDRLCAADAPDDDPEALWRGLRWGILLVLPGWALLWLLWRWWPR